MSWYTVLLVVVLLLVGNAFFVAVEFALLASRRGRIELWAEEGRLGATIALRQMRNLNLQLAACQLGITVMSLLLGWLIEPVGRTRASSGWVSAAAASRSGPRRHRRWHWRLTIVAFFHMVLGEMVPKSVALTAPERTAVVLAPLQAGIVFLVRPVVVVLDKLSAVGHLAAAGGDGRRAGPGPHPGRVRGDDGGVARPEASWRRPSTSCSPAPSGSWGPGVGGDGATGPVRHRADDGHGGRAEELVHRPATPGCWWSARGPDDVVGFLHAKDLLRLPADQRDGLLPPGLVRVALRVRPDERLPDLLPRMRRARRHVAVVAEADERGVNRVLGLVTLEDILEAIVGDIRDESDRGDRGSGRR